MSFMSMCLNSIDAWKKDFYLYQVLIERHNEGVCKFRIKYLYKGKFSHTLLLLSVFKYFKPMGKYFTSGILIIVQAKCNKNKRSILLNVLRVMAAFCFLNYFYVGEMFTKKFAQLHRS